MKEDRY